MESTQRHHRKTLPAGWMGHRDIPRPAVVRRESLRSQADWFDCLLTIWIAQAALDSLPRAPSQQEAA